MTDVEVSSGIDVAAPSALAMVFVRPCELLIRLLVVLDGMTGAPPALAVCGNLVEPDLFNPLSACVAVLKDGEGAPVSAARELALAASESIAFVIEVFRACDLSVFFPPI